MKRRVKNLMGARTVSPFVDLEAEPYADLSAFELVEISVDVLGRMALRRRNKLWAHEVHQLEDELFEVLAALNNLKGEENPSDEPGGIVREDGAS